MPDAHPSPPVDVGRLLDEGTWGGYQKALIALTALAVVFDGIDNQLLGVAIPAIMQEWSVPRSAFAPVVSLGLAGMTAGAAVAGVAGDRVGRRTALLVSMGLFGVMTAAAMLAGTPSQLGVLRFLAGIGLGGAIPNATALAAEFVPRRFRPIAVTVTIVCVPLGGTVAGMLGAQVLPVSGWRTLFLAGGLVPLVSALAFRWLLAESPRYLVRHPHRHDELARTLARMGHSTTEGTAFVDLTERGERSSLGVLFQPDRRGDTLALFGAFFSCLLAVYLGFSWLTSLLTSAGFDPSTASSGITAFNVGGVAGAIAGSVVIGTFGSRIPMLAMTAGAALGAFALGAMRLDATQPATMLFVLLTLTGGLINAVQSTMFALAAHVFPNAVRSTGIGTSTAVGRIGAVLSGYAGAWAIDSGGSALYFALIGGAMCAAFASLAAISRHVPRRQ